MIGNYRSLTVTALVVFAGICSAADKQTGCAMTNQPASATCFKAAPAAAAPAAVPAVTARETAEPAVDARPPEIMAVTQSAPAAHAATLANLQTAYNGESNARAKYLAYAVKADADGFKKIAQLFRAAARSEEIHAGFLAKNISALGAAPAAEIKTPAVKSTRENLTDAINGEAYETGTMYPGFLAQAKAEDLEDAGMAFGSAMKVEAGHQQFFADALNNLDSWKAATAGLYVCAVCGNLVADLDFLACSICAAPRADFEQIP